MTTSSKPKSSWRDVLPIHPAALMMPPYSESELRELGEDIKARGLLVPIVIYLERIDGTDLCRCFLLDGINRLDAMELVGIRFRLEATEGGWWQLISEDLPINELSSCSSCDIVASDPYTFVLSANLQRRHLTAEQKRNLIAKLIKANPTKSNRQIAEAVKVDHKTVASVRATKEATGEIPQLTKTIGKDGKARKTPQAERKVPASRTPGPEPRPSRQTDPVNLIEAFITQLRCNMREVIRQVGAAHWPVLIERSREIIDEIELEVEHRNDELRSGDMPDIPEFLRRSS